MTGVEHLRKSLSSEPMSKTAAIATLVHFGMTKEAGIWNWLTKPRSFRGLFGGGPAAKGTAKAVEQMGKSVSHLPEAASKITGAVPGFGPQVSQAAEKMYQAGKPGGGFLRKALPWVGGAAALGGLGYGAYQLAKPEKSFFERIGLGFDPSSLQQFAPIASQLVSGLTPQSQGFGLGSDLGLTPANVEAASQQVPETTYTGEMPQDVQGLQYYGEPDYSQFGY